MVHAGRSRRSTRAAHVAVTAAGRRVLDRTHAITLNDYTVALDDLVGTRPARSSPTCSIGSARHSSPPRTRRVRLGGENGRYRRVGEEASGHVDQVGLPTRLRRRRQRPSSSWMIRARSATCRGTRSNDASARSRTRCSGRSGSASWMRSASARPMPATVDRCPRAGAGAAADGSRTGTPPGCRPAVGRRSHAAAAVDRPSTTSSMSCGPGAQLGLDRRVLFMAQAVTVDDRLHELGPPPKR